MSFYSYKNANAALCPGTANGSILQGLNKRVCIQVKNVYDSCLQQEQLDDVIVRVEDIVPVLQSSACNSSQAHSCTVSCEGNVCTATCPSYGSGVITHQEAVENAENSPCPLPQPFGTWTFESCRSSTTAGEITNLTIDRLADRPQFARVRGNIRVPIDVLFVDQRCQEWMGQAEVNVLKDVLLCIPDESIVPFTIESLVSAICVSGTYIGDCRFRITICVTIVLKILAEVELMIPTYGFCEVPPCEEFAENVCDEFFSLPLFPRSSCCPEDDAAAVSANATGTACPSATPLTARSARTGYTRSSACSNCGTVCATNASICPRCGATMTRT